MLGIQELHFSSCHIFAMLFHQVLVKAFITDVLFRQKVVFLYGEKNDMNLRTGDFKVLPAKKCLVKWNIRSPQFPHAHQNARSSEVRTIRHFWQRNNFFWKRSQQWQKIADFMSTRKTNSVFILQFFAGAISEESTFWAQKWPRMRSDDQDRSRSIPKWQ